MPPRKQPQLTQIWQEHSERVWRAALMLSGNPWDADDLAQETFVVLAESWERFQGRSQVFTWLYGILLNLDRRRRRRSGTHQRKIQDLQRQPSEDRTAPAAESPLVAAEWKRSLWAWVHRLPDGQRQALVLRFSEELKYEQIAEILQCPLGTVKSRIYHGLLALKRMLGSDHEDTVPPEHPGEDISHAM